MVFIFNVHTNNLEHSIIIKNIKITFLLQELQFYIYINIR